MTLLVTHVTEWQVEICKESIGNFLDWSPIKHRINMTLLVSQVADNMSRCVKKLLKILDFGIPVNMTLLVSHVSEWQVEICEESIGNFGFWSPIKHRINITLLVSKVTDNLSRCVKKLLNILEFLIPINMTLLVSHVNEWQVEICKEIIGYFEILSPNQHKTWHCHLNHWTTSQLPTKL